MTRIIFPLQPQMRSPEVGDLHDALLLFLERGVLLRGDAVALRDLAALLRRERVEQHYGEATTRLVTTFRKERRLSSGREVDEATAAAMNALLKELGVLDPDPDPDPDPHPAPGRPPGAGGRVVTGEVRREDGSLLVGAHVRAAHETGKRAVRLGEDLTDGDGRYTIRYELLPGLVAVDLRVTVHDEESRLLRGSEVLRDARPLEILDLVVPVAAPRAERRIEGQIVLEYGDPAENVKLRLYRRDFGGAATLLAETATVADGRYAFAYDAGDGSAILELRAVKAANEEIALSESLPDVVRQPRAVLNLVAPAELRPQDVEYRRLAADLGPRVGNLQKLADAREDGERQDLSVLNRATDWDARLIGLAAVTERLAADPEVNLPQEGLYGLLRAGLPSEKLLLAQLDASVVKQALDKVREAGVIALTDRQIGDFTKKFAAFSGAVRLKIPAPGSRSTYGELLDASGLSQAARKRFAPVFLEHSGNGADLWDAAKDAGVTDTQIRTLRLQGKLAYLAGNSEAMTTRLMRKRIDDPAKLVGDGLHRAEAWVEEVLDLAGVPAGRRGRLTAAQKTKLDELIPTAYAGDAVEDRLRAYAGDMARKIRVSYPTQVLTRRLEEEAAFKLPAAHDATITLLNEAAGAGFRLGETPVVAFLEANPAIGGRDIPAAQAAAARQQVQVLQRVYQITPTDEAMPVLLALGMSSAFDVMAYPESEFHVLFDAGYLDLHKIPAPKGLAHLIHRKAKQVSSVTYNLFTIAKKLESDPPVAGISATPEVHEAVRNELIKRFPTMESLFGSMDFCECDHCRSVLSPAAYLVDLLQFIDPEPDVWSNFLGHWKAMHDDAPYPHVRNGNALKPYDVLVERRPDLPHIPLTCENTHTALPYIDIVNEILEYHVAHGTLESDAARDTGGATTAELLAEPQNVIREAYDEVRNARYPLSLPFDLWIEVVRRFCEHFETPLPRALEVLRPGDELFAPGERYDRTTIFMESLGLAPAEVALFTDPDPLATWHELYGFASAADATTVAVDADTGQRVDLNAAKALARRLGVTYEELAEIVQSGFVNPALGGMRLLPKLGVSIQAARLYVEHKDDPAPTTEAEEKRRLDVEAFRERVAQFAAEYQAGAAEAAALSAQLLAEIEAIPFGEVLVLADPDAGCDFDRTTLRYADGSAADPITFLRINLFVRLWRKLGWSIEEVDRALVAFVPRSAPFDADPANLAKKPLETALIYLAHLKTLDERLRVGQQSRLRLLTLWTDIPTTGTNPLYAQLFLTRSALRSAPVFDDPLGRYLADPAIEVGPHALTLQGALGLTADEIGHVLADAGVLAGPEAPLDGAALTLANVSILHRYGMFARALKLSVRELIALHRLSGLDPFAALHADPLVSIEEDHPFSRTIRFVEVAEEVKDSGFTVEDLDFLLRHRLDEAGKYRTDFAGSLALVKTLAEGIRSIRDAHAVPPDPAAMDEETLRQKLGQILSVDVVERFLALMNGTAEFTATRTGVEPGDRLVPDVFADEERIRDLGYKEVPHKEQKLTLRGVLFPAEIAALSARYDAALSAGQRAVFADLLAGARAEAVAFFDTHLLKQPPGLRPEHGFLDAADFDLLFDPTPSPGESEQDRLRAQRARLAGVFLPLLQQRLVRQFVLDTMVARTSADAVLVQSLITDARLLAADENGPLLGSFEPVAAPGIGVEFFDSDDLSGAPQAASPVVRDADTSLGDAQDAGGNPLGPAASARFEGYLEVSEPGAYRFHIELDKQDAEATLRFEHLADPVHLDASAVGDGTTLGDGVDEFLELSAGIPYRFRLELKQLGGGGARMTVQGETLPRGGLSRLVLYSAAEVDAAERTLLLLTKSLQLVQGLGLSERETRHVLTHADRFGNIDLSRLPTRRVGDSAAERSAATERFTAFLRLAGYARLRRDLGVGGDELIDIFEADEALDPADVYRLIARSTRRAEATVREVAEALAAAPSFASEKPLRRLWDALQVVERFGAPAASLITWTRIADPAADAELRFSIARDIKEAVKARLEPESWQRAAQPMFDTLRQQQRDALVSHVMHQQGFDRLEQLYEYLLIDPGMEPVVQTSRIRLAIASVQLFIQRCLLNLEGEVNPSTLNAKHWEWMKRYRVWEANRKIFLFPENWLEPEFRDDKTHLFAELEGALLQGDVSADLVEDAFLNYLRKLDELARLDIVAMHIEDNADPARRTLHVFGRTYSKPHKYFYRRYAHQMWTPWEPVGAEIEGDHLAPVVWRDRLYLFWVTFLDQADPEAKPEAKKSGGTEKKLTNLTMSEAVSSVGNLVAQKIVEVQLHWSEYLQGEWSSAVSGDFTLVTRSTSRRSGKGGKRVRTTMPLKVPMSFTPREVFVHVSKAYEAGEEAGVYIHLGERLKRAFYLAGRNSEPVLTTYTANGARGALPENPFSSASTVRANRHSGSGALQVRFNERLTTKEDTTPATRSILRKGRSYTLLPSSSGLTLPEVSEEAFAGAADPAAVAAAVRSGLGEIMSLVKPVFYQDDRHTFFVEPDVTEHTIEEWEHWVVRPARPETGWLDPDWWREIVVIPEWPRRVPLPDPGDPWTRFDIDRASRIQPRPGRDWLVNPATVLELDGEFIGPTGHAGLRTMAVDILEQHEDGGVRVHINPGTGVARGSVVELTASATLEERGLVAAPGGLNVVSGAGFNAALESNFNDLDGTGFGAGVTAGESVRR